MSAPASSRKDTAQEPVQRREAREVVRYWRATLRYEEALSAHPRARRPAQHGEAALNWAQPVAGQDYMKLPFAGAERFLLEQRAPCKQPLDAERFSIMVSSRANPTPLSWRSLASVSQPRLEAGRGGLVELAELPAQSINPVHPGHLVVPRFLPEMSYNFRVNLPESAILLP